MNTDKVTTLVPVTDTTKEISNSQLMAKLLELEKKLDLIEKKLSTPLIS